MPVTFSKIEHTGQDSEHLGKYPRVNRINKGTETDGQAYRVKKTNVKLCCGDRLPTNITFQVLRLSTFVFTKCSEKKYLRLYLLRTLKGFDWNIVGPASQTVVQHYISIGPKYRVIWCFWRDVKTSPA